MVLMMKSFYCSVQTLLLVAAALALLAWSPSALADKELPDDIYKPPDVPWENCQGNCSGGQEVAPDLRLYQDSAYWTNFADYKKRRLTVLYHVKNHGSETVYKVRLLKSRASSGVKSKTYMPIKLGCCLDAGESAEFKVVYKIPAGIISFDTYNYSMARNSCGLPFFYPSQPVMEPGEKIPDD